MTGGPVLEGEGASDYERYLRVPHLLRALKPREELAHRDEHLFQVVHQTAELWFHQIRWDVEEIERRIQQGRAVEATRLVRRCTDILKILGQHVHVLESMIVWDYHVIRLALGRGSGQESPGFQGILAEAPRLEKAYLALVERRGTTLVDVHSYDQAQGPSHPDLLDLGDALADFDLFFHLWRQGHLAFVKRMIGPGQRSLKGYGVEMLERLVANAWLFPELLALRDELTLRSGTSPPGKPPGAALHR